MTEKKSSALMAALADQNLRRCNALALDVDKVAELNPLMAAGKIKALVKTVSGILQDMALLQVGMAVELKKQHEGKENGA